MRVSRSDHLTPKPRLGVDPAAELLGHGGLRAPIAKHNEPKIIMLKQDQQEIEGRKH